MYRIAITASQSTAVWLLSMLRLVVTNCQLKLGTKAKMDDRVTAAVPLGLQKLVVTRINIKYLLVAKPKG